MKLLHFPEVSQAEGMKTGRQAVLWESKGSFRSWYSQERLICHPCLQAICDCQKCVCGSAGIMRVWCTLIFWEGKSERGFEAASLLSATCRPVYPWDLLFCFSHTLLHRSLSLWPLNVLPLEAHGDYGGSTWRHVSDVMKHWAVSNFLVQRNSVASCYHSSCGGYIWVCVPILLGAVKGTKSFVTCGFTCLVLKLMTNLWSVCSYFLAFVRVMSCMRASFSHTLWMPLQTFSVCWHCRRRMSVCVCVYMCIAFIGRFLQTTGKHWHPNSHNARLPSTIMTPCCLCVCLHVCKNMGVHLCMFSVWEAQKFYLAGLLESLRCKLDGRRV